MKMLKFVVFVLMALLLVGVKANPLQSSASFDGYALQESCVRQGGICVRKEDCQPSDLTAISTVLCPKPQHPGFVCCYL